jgi:hypothetical protein
MQTKVPLSHACFAGWEKVHSNRVLRGRCGLSLLSSPIAMKEEKSNPLQSKSLLLSENPGQIMSLRLKFSAFGRGHGQRVARSLPFTRCRTYLESTIQEAYERLQVFSWLQPKF